MEKREIIKAALDSVVRPEEKMDSDTLTPRCKTFVDEPCDNVGQCGTGCTPKKVEATVDSARGYTTRQASTGITVFDNKKTRVADFYRYGEGWSDAEEMAQSFITAHSYKTENERLREALIEIAGMGKTHAGLSWSGSQLHCKNMGDIAESALAESSTGNTNQQ